MTRRARACAAVLLTVGWVWVGACAERGSNAPQPEPAVDLSLELMADWWSLEQMENLDPNDPPAKETPVLLEAWEYTDPIGVPNPDRFRVVATIMNRGREKTGPMVVRGATRWRIGSIFDEVQGTWLDAEPLPGLPPLVLDAEASRRVRLKTVELRSLQDALFAQDRWPWGFEVEVELLGGEDGTRPIAQATAMLPIRPGD